jgi:hypothetical protein
MKAMRILLLSTMSLVGFAAMPGMAEANYWRRQGRQTQRYWERQSRQMHRSWNRGHRYHNRWYGPRAGWGRPYRGGIGIYW